jgi:hypothetical protein
MANLGSAPYDPLNIERVVSSIRLLADRRRHEAAPFVRSWTASLEEVDRENVSGATASRLHRAVAENILTTHGASHDLHSALTAAVREATTSGNGDIYRRLER